MCFHRTNVIGTAGDQQSGSLVSGQVVDRIHFRGWYLRRQSARHKHAGLETTFDVREGRSEKDAIAHAVVRQAADVDIRPRLQVVDRSAKILAPLNDEVALLDFAARRAAATPFIRSLVD